MRDTDLLQLALALVPPWLVRRSDFDAERRRLDIHIAPGAAALPARAAALPTARPTTPRRRPGGISTSFSTMPISTPGYRASSARALRDQEGLGALGPRGQRLRLAVRSADHGAGPGHAGKGGGPAGGRTRHPRLWRVIHHDVDRGRARADFCAVTRVACDETAARRGHDYITLFVDLDRARVLFATEGKDAGTAAALAAAFAAHGGDPGAVAEVCIDMSPAFIKGTADHLPNAAVTFDKFHAVKIINDAVDRVRRAEQKAHGQLTGTRDIWRRNPATLSDKQRATPSLRWGRLFARALSRPLAPTRSA
jgi:transposase